MVSMEYINIYINFLYICNVNSILTVPIIIKGHKAKIIMISYDLTILIYNVHNI